MSSSFSQRRSPSKAARSGHWQATPTASMAPRRLPGRIATPDTLARARAAGLDPHRELANNNGHGFFEALSDQVVTGPTLTNVNDFRAFFIP